MGREMNVSVAHYVLTLNLPLSIMVGQMPAAKRNSGACSPGAKLSCLT